MLNLDDVARYAASQGFKVARKTLLVEGTSDVQLLMHAALGSADEAALVGGPFAIVAAGLGDRGGASGVVRELITLRQISRSVLNSDGMPKYRFAALFDNDEAGNKAIRTACGIDSSVVENRDVFRLYPIMPLAGMAEPGAIGRELARENISYKGLKWEIEDALNCEFLQDFIRENPSALIRRDAIAGKVHWELTSDGKSRLHRFVRDYATKDDLVEVRKILVAIRSYLNIK